MNRRDFIRKSFGGIGALYMLNACNGKVAGHSYPCTFHEDNSGFGHLIRQQQFPAPAETVGTRLLIAGGGITGLSSARSLKKAGFSDFMLLELGQVAGGNAIAGRNEVSSYPWAAHYLPLPNNDNKALLDFLEEEGIITGYDQGLPVYKEEYICGEPAERLYIHQKWQEGLVPHRGIDAADEQQISRFFKAIESYRSLKGTDGRWVFDIPLSAASGDPIEALDGMSMLGYLDREGYSSSYLRWYLDYCCRDDYGAGLQHISAFAGIHYFASRRGSAANAEKNTQLTWPEGNAFLAAKLMAHSKAQTRLNSLLYKVELAGKGIRAYVYHVREKRSYCIEAEHLIYCLPYNTAKYVIDHPLLKQHDTSTVRAWPWMVANIRLKAFDEDRGTPLSWDNVIYTPNSLGYINNCHQLISQRPLYYNFTFYHNVIADNASQARQIARDRDINAWRDIIVAELKQAHPDIESSIEEISVKLWGHGMVSPYPGYLSGVKHKLPADIDDKIAMAHSDLSGISIFEEAFDQGQRAAQAVLRKMNIHA